MKGGLFLNDGFRDLLRELVEMSEIVISATSRVCRGLLTAFIHYTTTTTTTTKSTQTLCFSLSGYVSVF